MACGVAVTAPGGRGAWAPVSGTVSGFATPAIEITTRPPSSGPACIGSDVTVTRVVFPAANRSVELLSGNAAWTPSAPVTPTEMSTGVTAVFWRSNVLLSGSDVPAPTPRSTTSALRSGAEGDAT